MKLITSVEDIKSFKDQNSKEDLIFVPTMGALHEGHLQLIKRAQALCGKIVVSIFVNPTQFEPHEDFDAYPRDLSSDLQKLESLGVFAVFTPTKQEMFPQSFQSYVSNNQMSQGLCTLSRPNFFKGVCTVLTKLFILLRPSYAIFGKKDYQQLRIVESLVKDLNLDIKIIAQDIVRESNGLAMSSRNRYLTSERKQKASLIYQSLKAAQKAYNSGETNPQKIENITRNILLSEKDFEIDYVELRKRDNLEPYKVNDKIKNVSILFVAIKIAKVRLIDNIEIGF